MINIIDIILIAVSLSIDAFFLAASYGLSKVDNKRIALTSFSVGIFHFFMPIIGSKIGDFVFEYTLFKPNIILFVVFLILSIDLFISFLDENKKNYNLNIIGIILFSLSVSFDSFSVGIGIKYIFDNIIITLSCFSLISFLFTLFGFVLGKIISRKINKISFLIASMVLFIYSIKMLTN